MLEQRDELLQRTDCVEIFPIPFLGIGHFLLTCVVPAVLFAVQIRVCWPREEVGE